MKKIWLPTLLLLVLAPAVKGQECDCTIVPFKPDPPCKAKCTAALRALATATAEELELIVGLDDDVARRIANWTERSKAKTLKDYKKVVSDEEIKGVGKKLNSLNKRQLEYFEKPTRGIQPVKMG